MKSIEVLLVFFRLGLTSFGGPIAHLSYFHDEFVKKKRWISEHSYADLVALCQFLPGPASSQVGMAIGFSRSGILGALCAWIGFTLPSAIILILFALGLNRFDQISNQSWIHALKVVAVSVVAQAVWGLGKKLCPDRERVSIAIACCMAVVLSGSTVIQVLVLLLAGTYGVFFLQSAMELPHEPIHKGSRKTGALFLGSFFILLFILPILRQYSPSHFMDLADSFYRAGSLVFGGGHVVLPLLQAEVVPSGWVSNDLFMAGYGLSNVIPGPLFAFSAYLGAVSRISPNGWWGGLLCLVTVFIPSFLLVLGALPFWEKLRTFSGVRKSMLGLNAGVVGLLLAALYHPVWTSAIFSPSDFALALVGFVLLEHWKIPSWFVVVFSVAVSFVIPLST